MQTTKARARAIVGSGATVWRVTHAQTRVAVLSRLPRDGAKILIENFVMPGVLTPGAIENRS